MKFLFDIRPQSFPLAVALGCLWIGNLGVAVGQQDVGQQETAPGATVRQWITDPQPLLMHLKQRDAEFDNRTLQVDERWTERVSPRSQIASQNRSARQLGQQPDIPAASVPDDFDQPHRVRQLLTVRGDEITLEREAELATMKHPQYTALENSGHRWSSVGGVERSYSPETKSLHLMGKPQPGTQLPSKQRTFQWCCGYGFAKQIQSIDSVRVEGTSLLIKGKARLLGYDISRVELELDGDYIVRSARVFVPAQNGDGGNLYVVETDGTVRPRDCPPVAKTGHFKRILQPGGKPDRVYQELDIDFVSVSGKLTDPQYAQRTQIDVADDVSVIDFRPRGQR